MNAIFSSVLKRAIPREPIHIVLFPGTGCNRRIFKRLEQQFLPQKVIFHYEHTSQGDKMSDISARCADRLRQLIGKEMAIAVGHSLGGMNAAMTVDAAPELFRGLVLCNTRYRQVSELERQAKQAIIKKISRCTEDQFNKLLCRAFFGNQEKLLTEEEVNLLISGVRDTGMQTFLQQIKLSLEETTPNYQRILARLPITAIQGVDDTVMPAPGWEESGLMDSTTKYRLELVQCPGGHLSIIKHPERIASSIENMITPENSDQVQKLL